MKQLFVWIALILSLYVESRPKFRCSFDLATYFIANFTSDAQRNPPNTVWNRFDPDIADNLKYLPQPRYPTHSISKLRRVQLNFQAGAVFDENACIFNEGKNSQDWPVRMKYMRQVPAFVLKNSTLFEFKDAVFLWGSFYATDFQHAVIDLIPIFDVALELIVENPQLPIFVGSYITYFQSLYPFSLFRYIHRDFRHKDQKAVIPEAILFEQVYYVDLLSREQSYVLPGSYDRLLPFLHSGFKYNSKIHTLKYFKRYVRNFNLQNPFTLEEISAGIAKKGGGGGNRQLKTLQGTADRERIRKKRKDVNEGKSEGSLQVSSSLESPDFVATAKIALERNYFTFISKQEGFELADPSAERNWVVYLDRAGLMSDPSYVRENGKINGRGVANQYELLLAVERALYPQYRLVIHSCKDWRVDRDVMRRALVIMGPHGGHFSNMIFAPRGTAVVEFGRSFMMRMLDAAYRYGNSTQATGLHRQQSRNPRWVFVGLSNALGHQHWMIDDVNAVDAYLQRNEIPVWSDLDIKVELQQVLDTLAAIGVAS